MIYHKVLKISGLNRLEQSWRFCSLCPSSFREAVRSGPIFVVQGSSYIVQGQSYTM